jgi:hypothetical protein
MATAAMHDSIITFFFINKLFKELIIRAYALFFKD